MWTKVDRESLPPVQARVLICGGDCHRVTIGYLDREPLPEEWGFYFHDEGESLGDEGCPTAIYPTHWMPLPEQPAEAKYDPPTRTTGDYIWASVKWAR